MKKSILYVISVLMILSMVIAACTPKVTETEAPVVVATTEEPVAETEAPTEEPAPEGLTCAEPVKVGLITDLTGGLAIYGVMIPRSFMLGMEYATGAAGTAGDKFDITVTQENTFKIDNCEITVYVRDDGGNAENTTTIANELIEVQKVDVLVGTVSSANTAVLQGIAAQNKVPLIVAPAAANDITGKDFNEYTFRTSRNNYQDAINECTFLAKNYTNLVQIAPDYAFGLGSAAAFRDACSIEGATFVADDVFAPATTTDFTPYMDPLLNSGAEAYIVTWAGSGFPALAKAAVDSGLNDNMALAATFIDNVLMPLWYQDAIGSVNGIIYHWAAPQNPINDFLVAEENARYGVYPDLFDADGMNAAIMIVEALKVTMGDTSADALVAAMEGLSFEGPKGTVVIRPEDHVAIQDMYILQLDNLTDATANFYTYVETTRPEPPCLLPETLKDRCGSLPFGTLSGE
ncbi:MAG: substrate-binding domain-containing protein [Anaerolineaceae bacterium]|nr:substrate-binding domain-containing protein [Anaerolineaceae bacterium]